MNKRYSIAAVFQSITMPMAIFTFSLAIGQPDFNSKQAIYEVLVFQDKNDSSRYYHVPRNLELIRDSTGKPDFTFLQMRYTGTNATNDQGSFRFKSLLGFGVKQSVLHQSLKDSVIQILSENGAVSSFMPMPISNMRAELIYAASDGTETKVVEGGFFGESDDEDVGVIWKQRDFTLRLGNEDAELFWDGFHSDRSVISLNYSFLAKVYDRPITILDEHHDTSSIDTLLTEVSTEPNEPPTYILEERVINLGAFSLDIDIQKWPELLKQIDINEQIPPDYAALDIYCFDFNNDIRQDLFAKRIEVKAVGVGGGYVKEKITFTSGAPEVYAGTIHFLNAVKLKEPFHYRITEIFQDGRYTLSEWKPRTSWNQILDITTTTNN